MDAIPSHIGDEIRGLRHMLGWSQERLAIELARLHPTATRDMVARWETGKRVPGPFWRAHLATALMVPLRELEARVRRRELLAATAAVAAGAFAGTVGLELFSSVATGDDGPLARMQTSHETDLKLACLTEADRPVLLRLSRWAEGGATDVLRVNAAGILAKTHESDAVELAVTLLRRDAEVRSRYLSAVSARVGGAASRLTEELNNPRDAGARWCAAWLLACEGSPAAKRALASALRTERVTEVVRTIGMILNGDNPCA